MKIDIFPKTGKILDILLPFLYLAFILLAAVLIWKFISPFISVIVAAIISAILWAAKSIKKP